VPGWLVTITPSGIGEPVAVTPGLVPHCDVFTAAVLGLLLGGLLLLLPHPAAASSPITAMNPTTARAVSACFRVRISSTSWWQQLTCPFGRGGRVPGRPSPGAEATTRQQTKRQSPRQEYLI
jgi:hypothetical protein